MTFNQLGLSAELLRAVDGRGYKHPTPVQSLAIPPILLGGDLMARAQTGTGKTAGFTLPLLQRLSESSPGPRKNATSVLSSSPPPASSPLKCTRASVPTAAIYLCPPPSSLAASAFVRRSRR